ncbi:MAG: hypothetical protein LLG13_13070 [Bacteroidales bacterium]|nr:hypothetical protein [Bacteroidales bacterium]
MKTLLEHNKARKLWLSFLFFIASVITANAQALSGAVHSSNVNATYPNDRIWTWGYVIDGKLPGKVPFINEPGDTTFNGVSNCSLETGAQYIGTPNVVFMNSNHDMKSLTSEFLDKLAPYKQVICALQHGKYKETAKAVSSVSRKHNNIVGGLIDDFMDYHGPSKAITVSQTKAIYDALKSENQALKLYVVRYTWQDQKDLQPYLPYIDVINLWVWKAEEEPWLTTLEPEIDNIRKITGKPILLGLFIHDYGKTSKATPMNILELQFQKATDLLRKGKIEGFVVLQNGWFDHESHRPQIQWVKQYLDWLSQTQTVRAGE